MGVGGCPPIVNWAGKTWTSRHFVSMAEEATN